MDIVKRIPRFYALNANMGLRDIFIQNLREYRKEKKISQAILAEKCGTSTSYIGQIEIGNRFPSLEMIEKIAIALQIKPYLFFCDSDENAENKVPRKKPKVISDDVKNKLIKNLTNAVQRIVKNTH
ncbi:MAG: helix-turn-helix transcriptional regulator [Treponema sp.]|nr:helix-turn-helix transcriptional regulator [Treponema sp.]